MAEPKHVHAFVWRCLAVLVWVGDDVRLPTQPPDALLHCLCGASHGCRARKYPSIKREPVEVIVAEIGYDGPRSAILMRNQGLIYRGGLRQN